MRPSSDCPPDEALKLLIKHKNQVTSEDEEKIDLSVVTGTLEKDDELLENLGLIMERKDREMRMPPLSTYLQWREARQIHGRREFRR